MNNKQSTGLRRITAFPVTDLTEKLQGWSVVSVQLGYDDRAYLLLIDEVPERDRGAFMQTELEHTPAYKVLIVDLRVHGKKGSGEADVQEILIEGETFHYSCVQPLGEELLLVGARSHYYGRDNYDLNAAVFSQEGRALRRFLLGDGIQDVQTTPGGLIWTSFFDEGVFGNYGWGRPVGESGLIAWDRNGIRVFTNSEADIADCYALNVVSDEEVWFYYYTDFKLCALSGPADRPKVSFLDPNRSGSALVVTDGYRFLMDNGYYEHDRYTLMRQEKPGVLTLGEEIVFAKENGERIQTVTNDGRGERLLLFEESKLYTFVLSELNE